MTLPPLIFALLSTCATSVLARTEQVGSIHGQYVAEGGHRLGVRQVPITEITGALSTTLFPSTLFPSTFSSSIIRFPLTTTGSSSTALSSLTTPASPTSTQTTSPTPVISFRFLNALQACSSGLITWDYNGPSGQMLSMNVTNINVQQPSKTPLVTPQSQSTPATPPTSTKTQLSRSLSERQSDGFAPVNNIIAADVDASAGNYTWNPVNVRQGWYIVKGVINGDATYSPMFFVANGTDTSCMLPPPYAETGGHGKKLSTGVIVGVVVGGIAVIVAMMFAFILLCIHRRRHRRDIPSKPWTFPSQNSRGLRSQFSQSSSKHIVGSTGLEGSAANSEALNHDDVDPYNDVYPQEKLMHPRSPPAAARFFGGPDPPHSPPGQLFGDHISQHARRASQGSNLFDSSNPFDENSPTTPPRAKRASDRSVLYDFSPYHNHTPNLSRTNIDTVSTTPLTMSTLASSHRPPSPQSSLNNQSLPEYPPTPNDASTFRSSGRKSRQSRKPVPEYIPSDIDMDADLPSSFKDMTLVRHDSIKSGAHSSMITTADTLAEIDVTVKPEFELQSFGDMKMNKPVHILIPDMPPPSTQWF